MSEPEPAPAFDMMEEVRPYTYKHIPQLKELMPSTGGIPGVVYLQCCTENLRDAQDDGWGKIVGGSKVYTIRGPSGEADMELLCKGAPIPGADPKSGARKCFVDATVEKKTGHSIEGRQPEPVKAVPAPLRDGKPAKAVAEPHTGKPAEAVPAEAEEAKSP